MSTFERDNNPLEDPQALAEHIETALSVQAPRGLESRLPYEIVRRAFRPTVVGAERLPNRPCLFVGNHSLFALDGFVLGPLMNEELGRFVRGLGDKFLFTNPAVGNRIMKLGGVMGHPEVCSALMEAGEDLLVFPGGAHEAVKPESQLYSLQWRERYGFARLAAQHGYTIVPFGMVGPDEFYRHVMEGEDLPDSALGQLLQRLGVLTDDTRPDLLPPLPAGFFGSRLPKPQAVYIGFAEALDLSQHKGKKLGKARLKSIREEVAGRIEAELAQLLLLRERNRGRDGVLRRLLTL